MRTDEAAKAMIDGKIAILGDTEYRWEGNRFTKGNLGVSIPLPESAQWTIKRAPYLRELVVYLEDIPRPQLRSTSLDGQVLGSVRWSGGPHCL